MRDLMVEPAWTEEDLGMPLPDSLHAVSVCLPTWDAIIGYEEGRDKVLRRMRTGYPRFFRHPMVERLFARAKAEVAGEQEEVIVLPSRASVQRAHRWVELRAATAVRIASFHGLQVLVVPAEAKQVAYDYWRLSGEGVSSRQAMDFLDGALRTESKSHLLRRKLAKMTGVGEDELFVYSSGMAAAVSVLRALPGLRQGKKTLQLEFPYVDCLKMQEIFGHGVVFLAEAEGESLDEALRRIRQGEFAGVFTEAPGNPLLRVVDLEKVSAACAEGGTPLIVDDSASGPANVEVLPLADVVLTSLTKWLSGEGDIMAGMATVRTDSAFAGVFRAALAEDSTEAAPLYVADAEVLLGNVKGYPKRMEAANANGDALAAYLSAHAAVARVWHPSVTTRAHYDRILRKGGGYGGLLSFVLKNQKKTPKVYDAARVSKGPSFGTPFTLVCPYTMLAHYRELEWAEGCGVPAHLLRISCGAEPTESLLAMLAEALEHA